MIAKLDLRFASALLLVGLFFASMTPESQGVDLFDNLNQPSTGWCAVTNTQWEAQAFTTTSDGFILSEVSLRFWNNSGTTGGYQIQIWDATGTGGQPGAQVGSAIHTGLAQNLSTVDGSVLTVSNLNVTLSANTTYYVLARGTSLSDVTIGTTVPGYITWNTPSTVTSAIYWTLDSGSSWNGPSLVMNQYMKVSAVPEPSTLVMAGLGALAICLAARKRCVTAAA